MSRINTRLLQVPGVPDGQLDERAAGYLPPAAAAAEAMADLGRVAQGFAIQERRFLDQKLSLEIETQYQQLGEEAMGAIRDAQSPAQARQALVGYESRMAELGKRAEQVQGREQRERLVQSLNLSGGLMHARADRAVLAMERQEADLLIQQRVQQELAAGIRTGSPDTGLENAAKLIREATGTVYSEAEARSRIASMTQQAHAIEGADRVSQAAREGRTADLSGLDAMGPVRMAELRMQNASAVHAAQGDAIAGFNARLLNAANRADGAVLTDILGEIDAMTLPAAQKATLRMDAKRQYAGFREDQTIARTLLTESPEALRALADEYEQLAAADPDLRDLYIGYAGTVRGLSEQAAAGVDRRYHNAYKQVEADMDLLYASAVNQLIAGDAERPAPTPAQFEQMVLDRVAADGRPSQYMAEDSPLGSYYEATLWSGVNKLTAQYAAQAQGADARPTLGRYRHAPDGETAPIIDAHYADLAQRMGSSPMTQQDPNPLTAQDEEQFALRDEVRLAMGEMARRGDWGLYGAEIARAWNGDTATRTALMENLVYHANSGSGFSAEHLPDGLEDLKGVLPRYQQMRTAGLPPEEALRQSVEAYSENKPFNQAEQAFGSLTQREVSRAAGLITSSLGVSPGEKQSVAEALQQYLQSDFESQLLEAGGGGFFYRNVPIYGVGGASDATKQSVEFAIAGMGEAIQQTATVMLAEAGALDATSQLTQGEVDRVIADAVDAVVGEYGPTRYAGQRVSLARNPIEHEYALRQPGGSYDADADYQRAILAPLAETLSNQPAVVDALRTAGVDMDSFMTFYGSEWRPYSAQDGAWGREINRVLTNTAIPPSQIADTLNWNLGAVNVRGTSSAGVSIATDRSFDYRPDQMLNGIVVTQGDPLPDDQQALWRINNARMAQAGLPHAGTGRSDQVFHSWNVSFVGADGSAVTGRDGSPITIAISPRPQDIYANQAFADLAWERGKWQGRRDRVIDAINWIGEAVQSGRELKDVRP